MRSGGEILQAGSDGDHHIGFGCQRVGGGRPGDADRSRNQRMIPGHGALASVCFADRNAVRLGESLERLTAALAVKDAATGND